MRNRKEIENNYKSIEQFISLEGLIEIMIKHQKLILEVLLDIRDLK